MESESNDNPAQGSASDDDAPPLIRTIMFRFNYARDHALVQAVDEFRPFESSGMEETKVWTVISEAISKKFNGTASVRCVKQRYNTLIQKFKKEDLINRYKSGTGEEHDWMKITLTDHLMRIKDMETLKLEKSTTNSKKQQKEKEAAEEIREAALTGAPLKRKADDDCARKDITPKRTNEALLLNVWKEKQEMDREMEFERSKIDQNRRDSDRELREKEIELEREKLNFEKEKFEHEKQRQYERFELEKQEREAQIKTQDAILQLLLKMSK